MSPYIVLRYWVINLTLWGAPLYMNEMKLTVQEVLSRNSFDNAKVIAGKEGLDRQVKWSHVLEVKEFGSLINGGELILTTGVGLQLDLPTQLKYVKKLIEIDVACICIELGAYFKDIPTEIIELADEHNFPIIVFEEVVKFVDITQDLHTFIINQNHRVHPKLDSLSRKFIALSLMPNGILKILKELHIFFRKSVLFITDDGKSYYYPSETKKLETSIQSYFKHSPLSNVGQKHFTHDNQLFALMPVSGLGQVWGHLCLRVSTLPDDFSFLILDRAALAIAQVLLRDRTIEERKQNNEDEFVQNLLNSRNYEENDFQTYFPSTSRNTYYRVFIMQMIVPETSVREEDWEEIKLRRSTMIRALFKRHGFSPVVSTNKDEIAIIASYVISDQFKNDINQFSQVIHHITTMKDNSFIEGNNCTFGVSMAYKDFSKVRKGYVEASKTLQMYKSELTETFFYEDLGVYRLLMLLKDSGYLESYVQDYLKVLFEYDKEMDSNLVETLRIYLESGCSKKDTADRLFIVRQTLYHRLEKIESILGKEYLAPTNRITIGVAIMAHDLLNQHY